MLPVVKVIDTNKLRWFGHEERRRVNSDGCDEIKDEGKETKRKTKTEVARQHRFDRHKKGKNTSLKDVLGTKCFDNTEGWRI